MMSHITSYMTGEDQGKHLMKAETSYSFLFCPEMDRFIASSFKRQLLSCVLNPQNKRCVQRETSPRINLRHTLL